MQNDMNLSNDSFIATISNLDVTIKNQVVYSIKDGFYLIKSTIYCLSKGFQYPSCSSHQDKRGICV